MTNEKLTHKHPEMDDLSFDIVQEDDQLIISEKMDNIQNVGNDKHRSKITLELFAEEAIEHLNKVPAINLTAATTVTDILEKLNSISTKVYRLV